MAGALGRDHEHVDIGPRFNELEVDVEPVGEGERAARLHVRREVVRVDRRLMLVGGQHHDDVGVRGGVGVGHHGEARAFRLGRGLRVRP